MEPLAKSLGVSVMELMNGEQIVNRNTSCNVLRSKFFVCPICGNLLTSMGDAVISCCGITLPPLEAEAAEGEHEIRLERVEDETLVTLDHPMTKTHFWPLSALTGCSSSSSTPRVRQRPGSSSGATASCTPTATATGCSK